MAMDPVETITDNIFSSLKIPKQSVDGADSSYDNKVDEENSALRKLVKTIVNEIITQIKKMEITINSPEVKVTIPPATVTQGAGVSSAMNPAPIILTDVKGTINQNGGDIS